MTTGGIAVGLLALVAGVLLALIRRQARRITRLKIESASADKRCDEYERQIALLSHRIRDLTDGVRPAQVGSWDKPRSD